TPGRRPVGVPGRRATATALLVSAAVAALSVFVAAYTTASVGSRAE
ncbi:MAG: hypothetical protein QOF44_1419, partial [Streptomyces sp.]|nr:hypothetical protein [Streptomyces sp.]